MLFDVPYCTSANVVPFLRLGNFIYTALPSMYIGCVNFLYARYNQEKSSRGLCTNMVGSSFAA